METFLKDIRYATRRANQRGLPRTEGHRQGTENLRRILRASVEFGIPILTIYAF